MTRVIMIGLLAAVLLPTAAGAQVSVRSARLDLPASTAVTPGSTHTLVMQVSELVGLNSLQQFKLALAFDESRFIVTEVRPGSSLAAWPGADIVIENESGLVRVTGLTAESRPLASGPFLEVDIEMALELFDGERPRLKVRGAQPAEPILLVSDVQDPGAPIKVTAPDGVLVVSGGITCVAGDALGDGSTDSGDAVAVLRIVTGLIIDPDAQLRCGADANEDGEITAGDATTILRRAVGLDDEVPARVNRDPRATLVEAAGGYRLVLADAYAVHALAFAVHAPGGLARVEPGADVLAAQRDANDGVQFAAAAALSIAGADGEREFFIESTSPIELVGLELYDVSGARLLAEDSLLPTSTASRTGLRLHNSPNPFNPATTFWMELPVAGRVSLDLFDLRGRHLAQLLDEHRPAGRSEWHFTAGAMDLPSGVYFARLSTGSGSTVHRVTLLK